MNKGEEPGEAATTPAAATAPATDAGATPSTVNEVTPASAEKSTVSDAADKSVSSSGSGLSPCHQHQLKPGCPTKWSVKEKWDPFPNRIGEYRNKEWVIPEITTHAVPPSGITNTTMLQLEDDTGPLPGFAPYCSSSGWCGRPWGKPKDKEPEPRVGAYVEGEWVIPGSVPDYNKEENPRVPESDSVTPCSVAGFEDQIRCVA